MGLQNCAMYVYIPDFLTCIQFYLGFTQFRFKQSPKMELFNLLLWVKIYLMVNIKKIISGNCGIFSSCTRKAKLEFIGRKFDLETL